MKTSCQFCGRMIPYLTIHQCTEIAAPKTFGERLKQARTQKKFGLAELRRDHRALYETEARCLKQDEAARALGIDRALYYKYERDGIKRPAQERAERMAELFGVDLNWLLPPLPEKQLKKNLYERVTELEEENQRLQEELQRIDSRLKLLEHIASASRILK